MEALGHIRRYILAGFCVPLAFFTLILFPASGLTTLFFAGGIALNPSAIWLVTISKAAVKGSSFAPNMALAVFGSTAICVLFYTSVGLATCRALREYRLFFILLALSAHGPWWGYMLFG